MLLLLLPLPPSLLFKEIPFYTKLANAFKLDSRIYLGRPPRFRRILSPPSLCPPSDHLRCRAENIQFMRCLYSEQPLKYDVVLLMKAYVVACLYFSRSVISGRNLR